MKKRIFTDTFDPVFEKALCDYGYLYHSSGVPSEIRPFVSADLRIGTDLEELREWLRVNPQGRAIIVGRVMGTLPARCYRVVTLNQALRLIRKIA